MRKQFPSTNEIYVCESVFNLYTLNRLGFPTVALLGTGTSKQANILKKLPYRKVVLALDSDEAGEVGCNKLRKKLCYNNDISVTVFQWKRRIMEALNARNSYGNL